MEETPQETLRNLPHTPGVYQYYDADGTILYVGKAKDLKKRVSQYFQRDDALGVKTKLLVPQIAAIKIFRTETEFDALLLEAERIRTYKPKYNSIAKDDKSPLYIVINTKEVLPRVTTGRQSKQAGDDPSFIGPFQSGRVARDLLRHLRKIIPFCTQKLRTGRPCFYTHIGLCNPCPSAIAGLPDGEEKQKQTALYRRNVLLLRRLLTGGAIAVRRDLEKHMTEAARSLKFEEATRLKHQLEALDYLTTRTLTPQWYTEDASLYAQGKARELADLQSVLQPFMPVSNLHRIECYDISNISGEFATASMVVLTDGIPDTRQYRRFRMRTKEAPNDFAMMEETIRRRLTHDEWVEPNLIVIDGGKGQVARALKAMAILSERKRAEGSPELQLIPVIGLAKRIEEIIIPLPEDKWKVLRIPTTSGALHTVQRIRDEAHRFALTYHRLLRRKAFQSKIEV